MASTDFWWNFQQLPDKDPIQLFGGGEDDDETFSEELNENPQPETGIFGDVDFVYSDDEDLVFGVIDVELDID